jgi:hypothetical protein
MPILVFLFRFCSLNFVCTFFTYSTTGILMLNYWFKFIYLFQSNLNIFQAESFEINCILIPTHTVHFLVSSMLWIFLLAQCFRGHLKLILTHWEKMFIISMRWNNFSMVCEGISVMDQVEFNRNAMRTVFRSMTEFAFWA